MMQHSTSDINDKKNCNDNDKDFMKKTFQKQIIIEHFLRSEEALAIISISEACLLITMSYTVGEDNICFLKKSKFSRLVHMTETSLLRTLKSLTVKNILYKIEIAYKDFYAFNEDWLAKIERNIEEYKQNELRATISNWLHCEQGNIPVEINKLHLLLNQHNGLFINNIYFNDNEICGCSWCEHAISALYYRIKDKNLKNEKLKIYKENIYKKKSINQTLRMKVFMRDNFTCKECGFTPISEDDCKKLCADHIHPEKHGGETHLDNLQTLCLHCNSRKSTKIIINDEN